MCCQSEHPKPLETCNCCSSGMFLRRFYSSKETQEMLKEYKEQLKKELDGVDERIRELKTK